jgi:hypothetical protein
MFLMYYYMTVTVVAFALASPFYWELQGQRKHDRHSQTGEKLGYCKEQEQREEDTTSCDFGEPSLFRSDIFGGIRYDSKVDSLWTARGPRVD